MSRRAAAVLALTAFVAAVVALVVEAVDSWPVIVVGSVSLSVAIVGGWYAVSRRGTARAAGLVGAAAGLLALIMVLLAENSLRKLALAGLLGAISVLAAGRALAAPDEPSVRPNGSTWSPTARSVGSSRWCSVPATTCGNSLRMPSNVERTSSAWPVATGRKRWSHRLRAVTASRSS